MFPIRKCILCTVVIIVGIVLQFTRTQLKDLFACLAIMLSNWSQYSDSSLNADFTTALMIVMVPALLTIFYIMWQCKSQQQIDALHRAEIAKRFIDFRFVYLVGQLKWNRSQKHSNEEKKENIHEFE